MRRYRIHFNTDTTSTYIIIFSKLSVLKEYHNHVFSFFFFQKPTAVMEKQHLYQRVSYESVLKTHNFEPLRDWFHISIVDCLLLCSDKIQRRTAQLMLGGGGGFVLHRKRFSSFWNKHNLMHKTQSQTHNVTNVWHLHLNVLVRVPPERRYEWAFNQILNQTGCDAERYINLPVNRSPTVMLFD